MVTSPFREQHPRGPDCLVDDSDDRPEIMAQFAALGLEGP